MAKIKRRYFISEGWYEDEKFIWHDKEVSEAFWVYFCKTSVGFGCGSACPYAIQFDENNKSVIGPKEWINHGHPIKGWIEEIQE